jgi:hypothetical protein
MNCTIGGLDVSVSKTNFLRIAALGALIPAAIFMAPLSAQAASYTFAGQVPNGVDTLGGSYTIGPFGGGLVNFSEIAGTQPDPTQAVLFNPGSSGLLDATSFTITETGTTDPILSVDRGFGDFFETYSASGAPLSVWTATENAAGTQVTYTASAGDALLAGERFNTTTTFTQADVLPTGFAYNITWTGDSAVSAAPEPSTWLLMIAGVGLIGSALRFGRRRGWTMVAS